MKFLVRIISEHPKKAISLMFETVGPCLVRKLKWGWESGGQGVGHAPLVATALILVIFDSQNHFKPLLPTNKTIQIFIS